MNQKGSAPVLRTSRTSSTAEHSVGCADEWFLPENRLSSIEVMTPTRIYLKRKSKELAAMLSKSGFLKTTKQFEASVLRKPIEKF